MDVDELGWLLDYRHLVHGRLLNALENHWIHGSIHNILVDYTQIVTPLVERLGLLGERLDIALDLLQRLRHSFLVNVGGAWAELAKLLSLSLLLALDDHLI
jgi:hypothetical protein